MNSAVMKAGSLIVAFLILLSGIVTIAGDDRDLQASEDMGITSGFRVGTPNRGSQRVNNVNGHTSVFVDEPVAILVDSDEAVELLSSSPRGDPGSGWIYDVLVSDQAWNQYNDGFQSMEVDPTNNNDIYVVYESWTNFATGIDQWCLVVRRSTNGGETWSPEIYVFYYPSTVNGVYPDMKEPDIAIGNDGMIWLTYTIFAYDGPSRNIINMQIDVQYSLNSNWGSPSWTNEMVTQEHGGAYNYHRLPTISIDQPGNVPVISAMSYDAIAATQSSLVAWQPGATEWDGYEVLGGGPVNANYVQYPCQDSGAFTLYLTAMNYFETGGVFDMRIWSSDDGMTWTALIDIYDDASVYSFYKPCVASTKSGTDIVMCSATYTNNPSDQSLGDIAYAFSLNSGASWDSYTIPQPNYQRMPYVEEDLNKEYFMMTYRQEDGGSTYSTRIMYADSADLTTWYPPEVVSDTGAVQASNWFAHIALQTRPNGGDYPCVCWSDLRDAATPISETSQTHVVFSTYGSRVTFDTDPTGLNVIVDAQTYSTPQLFNWPTGYYHDIEAPDRQTGGGGENYAWDSWSNAGPRSQTLVSTMTDATYTAYYIELFQYTIPLPEGWNLISLPFIQADQDLGTVLSDIAGKWDYVMAYNSTLPEEWISNSIYRPDQLDDLNSLDHKMGIWIHIIEAGVELIVEGMDPISTDIPLYAGWNLVGYPSLTQTSIALALMGTGADGVEGYDAAGPYRLKPLAGSYMMTPGEGYWIHVPADATWTVNW